MLGTKFTPKIDYFGRQVIRSNWKRLNKHPLSRAGLSVRKIARQSIRRSTSKKRKPSKEGTPPRSHLGGATPPFKMIFSVPDFTSTKVIVGMVGFSRRRGDPVPGLHEKGGTAQRKVFVKAGQRRTKKGRFGKNFRKPITRTVVYRKRPFMVPALIKAKNKLPQLWRNSLR